MISVKSQYVMDNETELLIQSAWSVIKDHLESKRDKLYAEIRNYPPPIPACDQQFNFLLAERTRMTQVLNQLDELAEKSLSHKNPIKLIDAFIQSSPDINDKEKQKIKHLLKRPTAKA